MTFSYDSGESTSKDKVRGRIGDVTSTNPPAMFSDETIATVLTQYVDVAYASLILVERALALHARNADRSGAGINTSRSQVFSQLKDLRDILKREVFSGTTAPSGGTSIAEIDAHESDTDFKKPVFGNDPYTGEDTAEEC